MRNYDYMNVVILTDKFYPKPLANGICVQKIAESFADKGHNVNVIAHKDPNVKSNYKYKNISITYSKIDLRLKMFYYSINSSGKKTLIFMFFANLYSKIIRLLLLPFYPKSSISLSQNIYNILENIIKTQKIDLLISTFSPLENLQAGYKFRKIHNDLKWIIYFLDDFQFSLKRKYLPKFMNSRIDKLEKKYFSLADKLIVLKSNFHKISEEKLIIYSPKIITSDIPLLTKLNVHPIQPNLKSFFSFFDDKSISHWVYAGSMNHKDYDPNFLFRTFNNLNDSKKRILHLFIRGPLLDYSKKVSNVSNGRIIVHDYLGVDSLNVVLNKASILISIKNSNAISAKIFEYMNLNQKVIHFSGCNDDPDINYLLKYSNSLILRPSQSVKVINTLITDFEKIPIQNFNRSEFTMNEADYTTEMIIKAVNLNEAK